MKINSYRDLVVWQKAMNLVVEVYKILQNFPKEENYVLSYQIRKCVISVPSNIAEGYGRNHTADYVRFLEISRGVTLRTGNPIGNRMYVRIYF